MSDKPHEMAVRSPWTPGAWIMRLGDVDPEWQCRQEVTLGDSWALADDERDWLDDGVIVEARPSGGESS